MKNSRNRYLIIAIILTTVWSAIACNSQKDPSLIGTWQQLDKSRPITITFAKDSLLIGFNSKDNAKWWRVQDTILIRSTSNNSRQGQVSLQIMHLTRRELTFKVYRVEIRKRDIWHDVTSDVPDSVKGYHFYRKVDR